MIWQLSDARQLDLSERVRVMGILNVTPDSFYDGGHYQHTDQAIERALEMVSEGADVVDVGGQSSRPPMYGDLAEVSAGRGGGVRLSFRSGASEQVPPTPPPAR